MSINYSAKTMICSHFINSRCRNTAESCSFLHLDCDAKELLNFCNSKSSLCKSVINSCECKYGNMCNYAHSNEELNTRLVCVHGFSCRNKFSHCKLEHLNNYELTQFFIEKSEEMKKIKKEKEEKIAEYKAKEEKRKAKYEKIKKYIIPKMNPAEFDEELLELGRSIASIGLEDENDIEIVEEIVYEDEDGNVIENETEDFDIEITNENEYENNSDSEISLDLSFLDEFETIEESYERDCELTPERLVEIEDEIKEYMNKETEEERRMKNVELYYRTGLIEIQKKIGDDVFTLSENEIEEWIERVHDSRRQHLMIQELIEDYDLMCEKIQKNKQNITSLIMQDLNPEYQPIYNHYYYVPFTPVFYTPYQFAY